MESTVFGHQGRNRRLAVTLEDRSRVTQLLQKSTNTSDRIWHRTLPWNHQTETVRGVAVTQDKSGCCALSSCAVSQTEENSPATRPAWQLQFLHLHRGGSVELLGPVPAIRARHHGAKGM